MVKLTDKEFTDMVTFVKSNYGINLINKRQLIESRMYSVLREKKLESFSDYFMLLKGNDTKEITILLNKLTTNHTFFMREPAHFEFLKKVILPKIVKENKNKQLRIWSAGCSSGEEAYSTVMVIKDFLGLQCSQWDIQILATDISANAMEKAQNAMYDEDSLKNLNPSWVRRYFTLSDGAYQLKPEVKKEVQFNHFNLMDPMPYRKKFDLIFCRNVMIYFDQITKNTLINKFYDAIKPGGYLFIGHSETVQRDQSKFKYIQPSIYQKGAQ
jgi:chemotaxis protein methyltransferase CheR